jgi:magnesium transporter
VYSLVDAVIDSCFPLLTFYGNLLEDAEIALVENPNDRNAYQKIKKIDRELRLVRRNVSPFAPTCLTVQVRPMQQVVEKMLQPLDKFQEEIEEIIEEEENRRVSRIILPKRNAHLFLPETRQYIRDIASNIEKILDTLDTFKELCASSEEIYTSEQEHRSNKTMHALSIVSTFFLPLTFLCGVYGMNFEVYVT